MNNAKKTSAISLLIILILLIGCNSNGETLSPTTESVEVRPTPTTELEEPQTQNTESTQNESTEESGYPAPPVESQSYPAPESDVAPQGYPADEEIQEEQSLPEANPAADANVTFVRAVEGSDGSWTFHVTVEHPDTGWEDYADGWDVVTPTGVVVKKSESDPFTRLLLHPHETEQPFTRSQSGLTIPADVTEVVVRAHDLVNGWGGVSVTVDLTQSEGENYVVERAN
ncbi:MAG: hypothetical protein QNJ45_24370 [Ardenticatenaceae bacterium]|nr:hypothetical protein [Ardenticatenaceae bacterium]